MNVIEPALERASLIRSAELLGCLETFCKRSSKLEGLGIKRLDQFETWVVARLAIIECVLEKIHGIEIPNEGVKK